jgi:hypothetical protein
MSKTIKYAQSLIFDESIDKIINLLSNNSIINL